ncbi:type IV pilus secretin PilQ [Limnohabitans sp.]|uniref:type IV pilus secretin PilQ n=1 Tax=Limnohabitans sp. TaxID=1907725 RepID=UPI00286F34AC|nr:type IV pilus secretin PilQ [Limnohabitans sp.]
MTHSPINGGQRDRSHWACAWRAWARVLGIVMVCEMTDATAQSTAQSSGPKNDAQRDANSPSADAQGFTGKPMSLNFQNIEVRTALQIVADFTGLNIVTSDSVTGALTLRLHQVPWDQVLDIMVQAKGLSQRRQGNVIWVAPRAEVAARDKLAFETQAALQNLEPVQTRSFVLNYAKAIDVMAQIQGNNASVGAMPSATWGNSFSPASAYGNLGAGGLGGPAVWGSAASNNLAGGLSLAPSGPRMLSVRGGVMAEPRTNQLFVTDVPSRLAQVAEMLAKIDVPLRQVMIEARIVQASDTFGQTLGVRLGGLGQVGPQAVWGPTNANVMANANPMAQQANSFNIADKALDTTGQFVNLPAASLNGFAAGSFAVSIFNSAKNRFLNLELSALEADGKGKVVSSPRVVTADQAKAVIEQGTELPYQVASASGATTLAFRKANLKLEVTPQITPEGGIVLDLDISKDNVGQITPAGFAIDTKHVKTQVLVDNGGTVMIGGIYETSEQDDEYKVPFLGDLPVLGYLFKNRRRATAKQELLVFITPKMLVQSALAR